MVFKVQTHREETGDPLDMYRVNYDISHDQSLFRKGGKKIRLLAGKYCEFDLESSELVGGQIMK